MSTLGNFTEFSLIEVFEFIERGNKSGLLTVRVLSSDRPRLHSVYYIWIKQGFIVATANRLDHQCLVRLIKQSQWISQGVIPRLNQFCSLDKPLGLCLKNQGILNISQLKQLFHIQVLLPLFGLCQLKNGQFEFQQNVPIPLREMLGLSVPAGVVKNLKENVSYIQELAESPSSTRKGKKLWDISSLPSSFQIFVEHL